ncbi:hypothetical protein [Sorangium sp. So ce1024]|uniref:hypothetical protein n=1 Tax=Sorangium sp. So ce1024 TaxID=3133327 RepID=UPI003F1043FC
MHGKLEITFDSAAEIAEVTQALAGRPKDRLTWEERGALLAAGWRAPTFGSWHYPDGRGPLSEFSAADLAELRRAAAEARETPVGSPAPQDPKRDGEEASARRILARWPIAPAQDEQQATGGVSPEPTPRPLLSVGTVYFASREGTAEERAALVASLTQHLQATLNGQGSERGDVDLLSNVDGSVRLEIPRAADPRAVLATVAELLGLPSGETALDDRQAEHLREWGNRTPDEIAEHAECVDAELPRHGSWLRGVAAGIREGERRAKAKAEELVTQWEADRKVTLRLRDAAEPTSVTWGRRDSSAAIRRLCILNLCDAFDIEAPPPDGQPPTGGEPAPEESAAGDSGAVKQAVSERATAAAAEPPADADERWQPGAVWEHRAGSPVDVMRCTLRWVSADHSYACMAPGPHGRDAFLPRTAEMTAANGWRYVGRPASEARAEEPPATHTETCDGGVKVTAPVEMSLSEVWAALSTSPAFRVCLAADLRKEREEARALTPEAVRKARCDVQTAVLEDAFRAGVEEGQRRAHADGIVDGLRRANSIVWSARAKAEIELGAYSLLTKRIEDSIDAATRGAPVAPAPVDRAALLALAEGWETDAGVAEGLAAAAPSGSATRARHNAMDRGLTRAAFDLRRLLDAPRGPGGREREPEAHDRATIGGADVPPQGAHVDAQPARWGWWAMAPRRRALLGGWIGQTRPDAPARPTDRFAAFEALSGLDGWWRDQPEEHRRAYVAWLEAQRPTVDGEELGEALVGAACDLLRGSTSDGDVPPGPGGPRGPGAEEGAAHEPCPAVWVCRNPICRAPETSSVSAPCGCGAWLERVDHAAADPAPPVNSVHPTGGMGDGVAELGAPAVNAAPDREQLGRAAHDVYRSTHAPTVTLGWDHITDEGRARWSTIGERLFAMGVAAAGAEAEALRKRVAEMEEEIERLRAKGNELSTNVVSTLQDHSALVRVLRAEFGYEIGSDLESTVALVRRSEREQGAAAMRELAAKLASGWSAWGSPKVLADAIRALPLSPDQPTLAETPEAKRSAPPVPACDDDIAAGARAAGAQLRRVTPEGYTQLPAEMVDALGLRDGGALWFLRSTVGGRWEAWREHELDREFGFTQAADATILTAAGWREDGELWRDKSGTFVDPRTPYGHEAMRRAVERQRAEAVPADAPVALDAGGGP